MLSGAPARCTSSDTLPGLSALSEPLEPAQGEAPDRKERREAEAEQGKGLRLRYRGVDVIDKNRRGIVGVPVGEDADADRVFAGTWQAVGKGLDLGFD